MKINSAERDRYSNSKWQFASSKFFKCTFLPTGVVALVLLVVVLNAIAVMISTNLGHSSANAQDVSEDMCLLLSAKVHYAWFPCTIKPHYSLPKKQVDYCIN